MSSLSHLMVMRASVSRGSVANPDSYGLTSPRMKDLKPVIDQMPIYVWIQTDTDYVDGKSVAVERMKGYCRKTSEIQRLDVITQITNRNGDVLFTGPIVVDVVTPKNVGAIVSHFQLELRRHNGT